MTRHIHPPLPTIIVPKNPDDGLIQAIQALTPHNSVETASRNGPVVRFNGPVITAWTNPIDRILWSPTRDCNPFLHFIEAAWMLAGRNDVKMPAYLAANMANYSDDGAVLHGAYGHRWRHWFGTDQITALIAELKNNRGTRRIVLQMWDGRDDLAQAVNGKDIPCNTAIYFDPVGDLLNMTVTCRSNDAVWGCYGANLVHMSILHEYIATQTGFETGTYFQVSNNLHFYLENEATKRMMAESDPRDFKLFDATTVGEKDVGIELLQNYGFERPGGEPLFYDLPEDLSDEQFKITLADMCEEFVTCQLVLVNDNECHYFNVLSVMMDAFNTYKTEGAVAAVDYLEDCMIHSEWVLASILWLKRRASYKEYEAQQKLKGQA